LKGYNIKYEGVNKNHYKYDIYKNGSFITYFISSEEINLNNKNTKREAIEELVSIINKYKIKGI